MLRRRWTGWWAWDTSGPAGRSRTAASLWGGEDPVVSKFGQVLKQKPDGEIKRRLILDAKESGVTPVARKNERILLPGILDVVWDSMRILQGAKRVHWFVTDVKDAFWSLSRRRRDRHVTGRRRRRPPWAVATAFAPFFLFSGKYIT